jgi:hypothetical protein
MRWMVANRGMRRRPLHRHAGVVRFGPGLGPFRPDLLTPLALECMRTGQVEVAQIIHQDGVPDPGHGLLALEPCVGVLWLGRS